MLKTAIKSLCFWAMLFSLLSFYPPPFASAEETSGRESVVISAFDVLPDPDGSYGFAEVSSAAFTGRYQKVGTAALSFGITRSVYWIRFAIPVSDQEEQGNGRVLQLNNPNIDKINLYLPIRARSPVDSPVQYKVGEMGVSRPANSLNRQYQSWGIQLPGNFYEGKDLYLRLESTSALRLPIVIWQPDAFFYHTFWRNMKFGGFYGILLAMLMYNLFLFSSLRDKTYLFYVLYISSMLAYQLQVHGHLKLLVDLPYQLYNGLFWLILAATFGFSILFTKNFLQSKITMPIMDRILTWLLVLAGLQGGLGVLNFNIPANQIAHGLALLGPAVIIVLSAIRLRQGFKPARYYLVAWGILAVGIALWALSAYIPIDFNAVNCLLFSTACETVLLSLALADRIKTLQYEKDILGQRVVHFKDLSLTDELTGLYNKRCLYEKLTQEIAAAAEQHFPLSVLVMDIDHFKDYNDHYGHLEGDKVLAEVGIILSGILRETDSAFRYGGEEFTIILPNTAAENAFSIAQRLREAFFNERFTPTQSVSEMITVSIGLTEYESGDTPERIFNRADSALYQAKNSGRNRVELVK